MKLGFLDDPGTLEAMAEGAELFGGISGDGVADVFGEDSFSSLVVFEDQRVEAASLRDDRGVGLRLKAGGRTLSAALADPTPAGIVAGARALLSGVEGDSLPAAGGKTSPLENITGEPLGSPMGLDRMVDFCGEIDRAARAMDRRVMQVRVVLREQRRHIAIARPGFGTVQDRQGGIFLSVQVIAAEGPLLQTGYEAMGGTLGEALFEVEPPVEMALKAARRAIAMLGARPAPLGPMCVVLASEAGGTMIHEAIGHGLEADLVGEGHSVYRGMKGRRIASKLVTVVDDPTLAGKRGSYRFDDEGEAARRTILVENGILKRWLHSRETAAGMGLRPSGNGRRESFRHPPIPRMSNTMIAPGFTDPGEIIRATPEGFYVTRMGGGQVDTVSGDFVFEVSEGFLIENGRVGEPLRGATIAGNGPDALKSIDMVGNDLGFGVGTCGKDGQGAPVSDAQPTLRIPELIVGGCAA